ncbi:MAG: ABC transporter substrate-binding protein [Pseudomonadota bacterium]
MPAIQHRLSPFIRLPVALLLFFLYLPAQATATDGIASIDWTLAETLVALGEPPIAVAQVNDYHDWVGEPRLPDDVADLGLRSQPNMERLARQSPQRILISPMFSNLSPRLERIAPVESLTLYSPGQDTWTEMLDLTRTLGDLLERPDAAEALIASTESHLKTLSERLPDDSQPLLIVQFMDARHVRVFGENGLFQAVMDRLGLENAWQEETNAWGFSLVGLERLVELDARLVVVEPYPTGIEEKLRHSALWQHQSSVRDDTLINIPPTWSFGALPSAQRFAELIVTALERPADAVPDQH